jgi:hypothetical protein
MPTGQEEVRTRMGLTAPSLLLRAEGLTILVAAVTAYAHVGAGWWLFAAGILAPDLGLAGYLLGRSWGTRIYNLFHTLVLPLALGILGLLTGGEPLLAASLIWLAHIGMDRAAGFGLKYPSSFAHTHLQRTG